MRSNPVKETLRAGGVSIGTMVFEFSSPGLPRLLDTAGAEFAIYDMEHSGFSLETIKRLMASSRGPSPVPLVRVPAIDPQFMAHALDVGALGLMVPMVETRQQAEEIVDATYYPPVGHRGAAFGLAHDDYERGDGGQKIQEIHRRTMLIAQIESQRALDNLEDIAAVEGLDVLWVGHFDLTISMGIPAQFDSPRFLEAMDHVAAVCARHGLAPGINVDDVATAERWLDKGFRAIAYSADHRLLVAGLRAGVEGLRHRIGR